MGNSPITPEIVYNLGRLKQIKGMALFSSDQKYRYLLTREWGTGSKIINWIMCNPSIADSEILDPTVRKCLEWSILWGYDRMAITNIFAYKSTDVKQIYKVDDPIGPENDLYIKEIFKAAKDGLVVCGWGGPGEYLHRSQAIQLLAMETETRLYCLETTSKMQPHHPLYLPKSSEPRIWSFGDARPANDEQ